MVLNVIVVKPDFIYNSNVIITAYETVMKKETNYHITLQVIVPRCV